MVSSIAAWARPAFDRLQLEDYDFVALGGEGGAKEAGKTRVEGKEYVVKDGDVLHFLFNA